MITVKGYPANKKHFIRLTEFCMEIIDVCKEAGIAPIAYGSMAFFGYTRDKNVVIHDIDLLVPEKSLAKIRKLLQKRKIKYSYRASWHGIKVFKNSLVIELDAVGFWQKGLPISFKYFNFSGLIVKTVNLTSLKKIYKRAARISHERPEASREKFEILEKLKP
jgi:hypothetical protein